MRDFAMATLPNGIRVVHKQISHTKIVHCGFVLDIGSRDENIENQGIAHFWEHMAFKGTSRRKAFHIINRLEAYGGELNAYTTKEKITFYASVLSEHFDKAFDLLTDITFHSIFPEKQINNERNVILEEMAMYKDSPEDNLQDEFDNLIFNNHPLGMDILGISNTVKKFQKEDFTSFIANNINTEKIVFSCVGNLPFEKVKKLAERYLTDLPKTITHRQRTKFIDYRPKNREVKKALTQSLCAMGRPAYAVTDNKRIPFFMLVNILGGPGMNSRLNMALREKHGFVYSVDANYSALSDTGLFSVSFGCEPQYLHKSLNIVKKEFRKLREDLLGSKQLHTAKQQLKGQLAMSEENNAGLMLAMGKSFIDLERIPPLKEIFNEIDEISSHTLRDIANEILVDEQLSYLTFNPN